jgi:hypothetical protein
LSSADESWTEVAVSSIISSANEEEEEEEEEGRVCANAVVVVCNNDEDSTPEDTVSSKRVNMANNTLADFDGCEYRTDFTILSHMRYHFKHFAFSGSR